MVEPYPSAKWSEFVSWDDDYSQLNGKMFNSCSKPPSICRLGFHQPSSELYWGSPILRTPHDTGATRLHDMGKQKHPLWPSVSKIFTTAGETPRRKKVEGDWNGTVFRAISEPSLNNAAPLFLKRSFTFLLQFTDILKISSRTHKNKDIRYRLPISSEFPSKKSANPEISQPCGGCFGFAVWTFPAKRPRCFQLFSRGERWEIQPDSVDK